MTSLDPNILKIIEEKIEEKVSKAIEVVQISLLKDNFLTRDEFLKAMKEINDRFEAMQKQLDNRFEAMQKQLDNRFEAMQKQINISFEEAKRDRGELKAFLSKVSSTRGIQLENAVLDLLKDRLIRETISVSEIKKEYLFDKEGTIFYDNYSTDVDVLIQDGKTVLIEVKSGADNRDIHEFLKKAALFKLQFKKNYDVLILVCLEINQRNFEDAIRQGIKVIAGDIV